tara:strand:+ start:70 stop:330 length:261 start_codon:yes stop_codon:yes gene_type:complete
MNLLVLAWLSLSAAYPANVSESFLTSCVGSYTEMLPPCKCIMQKLQAQIPYPEYERLAEQGQLQSDARIKSISRTCMQTAAKQQRR